MPGMCANIASGLSEWCSGAWMPAPQGVRSTIGQLNRPCVRCRRRPAWFRIWSIAVYAKPANWNSATGRKPSAAMPTAMPAIRPSASGVSATRSAPKRCCSPAVARNTPPLMPTSSPSTTTRSSSSMARASARLTASTSVMLDIALLFLRKLRGLRLVLAREARIQMLEHLLGSRRRRIEIGLNHLLHVHLRVLGERLLVGGRPGALRMEPAAQPQDRLLFPLLLEFVGAAVARCVVRGRVVAQPISQRFQQRRSAAGARAFHRAADRVAHGDEVVAIELLAGDARGDRLLRERLRGALHAPGHGDGVLVVHHHHDHRQLP